MMDTSKFQTMMVPWLSTLNVDVELIYYDRPLCLLFKNTFGQHFIGHYLDGSSQSHELWLIVPIHDTAIPRLLRGQNDLLSVFTSVPEECRFIGEVAGISDETYSFASQFAAPSLDELHCFLPKSSFLFFEDEFNNYLSEELGYGEIGYHGTLPVSCSEFKSR